MVFMHTGSPTEGKSPRLTTSNLTVTRFYSFFRNPNLSEEKYDNDEPVCQKWNSQQILVDRNNVTNSRRYSEYAANMLVGRNRPKFLCIGIMANIRGLYVSMHCSMASQVMGVSYFFFQFYELSMLLNYQIYFGTVAASNINGVSWQRDIS